MKNEREALVIVSAGILVIAIAATCVNALFPDTGMVRSWNDALFLLSTITFCAGSTSALVSKSRRHYYLHLKDKYSGKVENDSEFEKEQERRNLHAKRAVSVALSGVVGIVMSAVLVFVL